MIIRKAPDEGAFFVWEYNEPSGIRKEFGN